jgi:hypothetical protein
MHTNNHENDRVWKDDQYKKTKSSFVDQKSVDELKIFLALRMHRFKELPRFRWLRLPQVHSLRTRSVTYQL